MCAATSRAIWSCDWGSEGDTPIAATHRGDASDRSSSSSSSPAPNARWTTCATSEESTPPEKATTCIRAPAPAARVDSTIASSSRASRASSSRRRPPLLPRWGCARGPSSSSRRGVGVRLGRASDGGRGTATRPRGSRSRPGTPAPRRPRSSVPSSTHRASSPVRRPICDNPTSTCTILGSPETVPTRQTNVRELSRRRRPCRRRTRNPPPSAPRSSRSAG